MSEQKFLGTVIPDTDLEENDIIGGGESVTRGN